jgi:exosortase A
MAFALPVVVSLAAIAAVHYQTFASLVGVWLGSETFAHCFVIVPISLFLIWRRREDLARAPKRVSMLGMAAVGAISLAWLVASMANVQIGQQLSAMLLLPACVLALLGPEATKRIALPLAYLLFAVPFGEALIPALMDFTAYFTVLALQLTGIPVLREGYYFSIPSGDFEVAKACSGIRYLIACVALGVLYAYLSYDSWRKRAVFIAISVIAPIAANGLRAYGIVMIAHLSSMRLAVGVDHLIYGWLFFGALIALLFWVGGKFRDPLPQPEAAQAGASAASLQAKRGVAPVAALVIVALAAAGPFALAQLERSGAEGSAVRAAALPSIAAGWTGPELATPEPQSTPAASDLRGFYSRAGAEVEVELRSYGRQMQGAEMVGSIDANLDREAWQLLDQEERRVSVGDRELAVVETVLRSRGGHRVRWHWYVIGGTAVASDWRAKVLEAWKRLRGDSSTDVLVAVSARHAEAAFARDLLSEFMQQAGENLVACVASDAAGCDGGAR